MLRSMTGHGQARHTGPLGTMTVEVRTVNNRHLKLSPRLGEALGRFEPQVEAIVRRRIRRGSVLLNASWHRAGAATDYQVNSAALAGYYRQLDQVRAEVGASAPIDLTQLLQLPGVICEATDEQVEPEAVWTALERVLVEALDNLNAMRDREGASMARQLEEDLGVIEERLDAIRILAPRVATAYHERLQTKVEAALRTSGLESDTVDVLREVQVFADRSDVSEEITRLASHLDMFRQIMEEEAGVGRKLDFVIQEIFRETNTIGSKAQDAEIARHVVEVKCATERMRELVQNVE